MGEMGSITGETRYFVSHHILGTAPVVCSSEEDAVVVLEALESAYSGLDPQRVKLQAAAGPMLKLLQTFVRDYDCDEGAHRRGFACRRCMAEEMVRLATGDKTP